MWVTSQEDWETNETQQWILDSIVNGRRYMTEDDGTFTLRIPYGLTRANYNFFVAWLLDEYPGDVFCFSPRKAKYVSINSVPTDDRKVFKIRVPAEK